MSERLYKHDCYQCRFLGTTLTDNVKTEWYFCPAGDGNYSSIIGRFGEEGDYWSMNVNIIKRSLDSDKQTALSYQAGEWYKQLEQKGELL